MRVRRTLTAAFVTAAVLIPLASSPALAAKPPSGSGSTPTGSATAIASSKPALLGTNTSAAAKERWLTDLAVEGTAVYSTYGDYDRNIGPIDLNSIDTSTGALVKHLTVNGEELMALRSFDGKLYTADVDPKVSNSSNSGYATNASGSWQYVAATPFEHIFDVAKLGNEIFLSGSMENPDPAKYGPARTIAVIKKSSDGGKTWTIEKVRSSKTGNTEYDRYYWLAVAGGKVVAQADLFGEAESGASNTVVDVYSSGAWTSYDAGFTSNTSVRSASQVNVLGSKVLITEGSAVWSIDVNAKGKARNATRTAAPSDVQYRDAYVADGVAYVLGASYVGSTASTRVLASRDGSAWTEIDRPAMSVPLTYWDHGDGVMLPNPQYYSSIAVSGGKLFLGGSDGAIYTAPAPTVP